MSTEQPIRLSELAGMIHDAISITFEGKRFWVVCEVVNLTYYAARNIYFFDLVEKEEKSDRLLARLPSKAFDTGVRSIREFERETGQAFGSDLRVLAQVSVDFHPQYGLQLELLNIDPSFTLGQLEQLRRQTIARLVEKNRDAVREVDGELVTRNQELEMAPVVQYIAVVASETSAGFDDFVHTLERNDLGYSFAIDTYFTTVQGAGNERLIAQQFLDIFESGRDYDAVVLIRGGGARTDLMPFDSYTLSRVIARFPIPVVTGIGHHRDQTICDMVAHTRTKTPTRAAEFLINRMDRFEQEILTMRYGMFTRIQKKIATEWERLHQTEQGIVWSAQALNERHKRELEQVVKTLERIPARTVYVQRAEVGNLASQLQAAVRGFTRYQHRQLNHYQKLIKMVSPDSTLKRGFALLKRNEEWIADPSKLKKGSKFDVYLTGRKIEAEVLKNRKSDEQEDNL